MERSIGEIQGGGIRFGTRWKLCRKCRHCLDDMQVVAVMGGGSDAANMNTNGLEEKGSLEENTMMVPMKVGTKSTL